MISMHPEREYNDRRNAVTTLRRTGTAFFFPFVDFAKRPACRAGRSGGGNQLHVSRRGSMFGIM